MPENRFDSYTALDMTRSVQLDRVCHLLALGLTRLKAAPKNPYNYSYVNVDGEVECVKLEPRFLYGVWRIRQTLVKDLSAVGHQGVAGDIVARHEGRR